MAAMVRHSPPPPPPAPPATPDHPDCSCVCVCVHRRDQVVVVVAVADLATLPDDPSRSRSVNELLADLRRASLNRSGAQASAVAVQPTVPPAIRHIFQLPETPPPRPRRPARVDASGARLPPGPAPPRSWLSAPSPAEAARRHTKAAADYERRPLPDANLPARGSLVDLVLRRFALDWEWQRSYNRYHLYELPTHLRAALISYLVTHTREGVSLRDLQAVLLPPADAPEHYFTDPALAPGVVNETFSHLDLSGSLGRSLGLRELSDLLFPKQTAAAAASVDIQESWDAPEQEEDQQQQQQQQPLQLLQLHNSPAIPRPLLPNLTHLSLALDPARPPATTAVSWRHLLAFAGNLSALTHLSLAFWPEPTLTPNAKLATVAATAPQYGGGGGGGGGTGPYSHALDDDDDDDDWAEAVLLLRRLARCLYRLEYLDLTGCGEWFPALWATAVTIAADEDGGTEEEDDKTTTTTTAGTGVDWVGAWGKITTLVLYPGYRLGGDGKGEGEGEGEGKRASAAETRRYWEVVERARRVERHVRAQRRGKGRFITVETCKRPGEL